MRLACLMIALVVGSPENNGRLLTDEESLNAHFRERLWGAQKADRRLAIFLKPPEASQP